MEYIPGTTLTFNNIVADNCFSLIAPLLTVTKGLTLAQVRELTGLETSTIQNWIKRGWVKILKKTIWRRTDNAYYSYQYDARFNAA